MNSSTFEHVPLYGIGTIVERLKLHERTLIKYDRFGLCCPARNANGARLYSEYDLKRIRMIHFLQKEGHINLYSMRIVFDAVRELLNHNITPATSELSFIAAHLQHEMNANKERNLGN